VGEYFGLGLVAAQMGDAPDCRVLGKEGTVGGIDIWDVESATEAEAARGRSPQAQLVARHRDVPSGAGILPPEGVQRLCDLSWFPRPLYGGEGRKRMRLYQVRGIDGLQDGVYGPAPEAEVKQIFFRWFGSLS